MLPSATLLCLALAASDPARADVLAEGLAVQGLAPPDLVLRPSTFLLAAAGGADEKKEGARPAPQPPRPGELDFDLLGEAKAPGGAPDPAAMKRRRQQLTVHQGIGFGLVALQLGTTVVGQLNYRDKFATGANTEKWRTTHKALAYTTAGVLLLNGAIALTAPSPEKRPLRLDRVTTHRFAMYTVAAAMAAQVGLGIYTSSREGFQNQRDLAKVHLYLGYGTLAALATGVSVLVF